MSNTNDDAISNYMLKELNRTFITLIPKRDNPESVNRCRPISLCNISYKIISKILINRLKIVLPKIISPLQDAFVQGRDIHDNILVAHELLSSFSRRKNKQEPMAIKLDMEKAYDRLDWRFIRKYFQVLGLAEK